MRVEKSQYTCEVDEVDEVDDVDYVERVDEVGDLGDVGKLSVALRLAEGEDRYTWPAERGGGIGSTCSSDRMGAWCSCHVGYWYPYIPGALGMHESPRLSWRDHRPPSLVRSGHRGGNPHLGRF